MAITVPVAGSELSVADFGNPVVTELNRAKTAHYSLAAQNTVGSGYVTNPSGSSLPPVITGSRRWTVMVWTVLSTGVTVPYLGYCLVQMNGVTRGEYGIGFAQANTSQCTAYYFDGVLSSVAIMYSNMNMSGGHYLWIDGGPY